MCDVIKTRTSSDGSYRIKITISVRNEAVVTIIGPIYELIRKLCVLKRTNDRLRRGLHSGWRTAYGLSSSTGNTYFQSDKTYAKRKSSLTCPPLLTGD